MADINCVLWNCAGLSSSSAKEKNDFLITSSNFDILVLVETHHKHQNDIYSSFHTYRNSYHFIQTEAVDDDPYAGIIVLVNNIFTVSDESVMVPGRLLGFKINNNNSNNNRVYNVSALYGFTGKKATQCRMKKMVEELSLRHKVAHNNLILGDFNFVENDLDRVSEARMGKNRCDVTMSNPWVQFASEMDLSDPFRVKNPKRRMFSYIHTQHRAKSRIDRVYMNDEDCQNVIHYKHVQTPFTMAHRMVTFTIKESATRGPGYWKMNSSILTDRAYHILVEKCINEILALNIPDPIERWLVFIETIRIETRVYCSRKAFHENRLKSICESNIAILEQNPLLSQRPDLHRQYERYVSLLNEWTLKKIQGHQTRVKTQPKFEIGEPNIAFFAQVETKSAKKRNISELQNNAGEMKFQTDEIKEIAVDFYTDLFSEKKTDAQSTEKLLRNMKKKISIGQKNSLDRIITEEELEKVVNKLKRGKSPGPDGIPAEFYQQFWPKIKGMYLEFINQVRTSAFPNSKNVSITTLIYKDRGVTYLLTNYRPIALMNVDVKILTKLLAMRLNFVLPTIIHESQTAVYGRKIHNTVHLVRDLIDLANQNDDEAALLFLDQEKAFDRVNHKVLLKVLENFGFGESFISWIKIIYSNASTKLNINGFLTDTIPLKSGVRQGCPLSALLYVMVIELLALQLRANPNIVGFTVQGEKIISSHYSDDAVIKITQNRCFKEVYKDLELYEQGTGAKVNYEKTKGLWLGKWRDRTDDPFSALYKTHDQKIKWTNKNVKYLGVYVGNDNPALYTFQDIIPKVKRRLNFWKPLSLPILAKARVIEIYHASKLWYAGSFYQIPESLLKEVDDSFMDYIIFPKKKLEVSRTEMEKERVSGGIKLINTKLKSITPKIHWLISLITDENLGQHLQIFKALIGVQKGQLRPEEIIFADQFYMSHCLDIHNDFYKEAFQGICKLNVWKHVPDIRNEHVFYNPIFTITDDDDDDELQETTLKPFTGNQILAAIRTYGDLFNAQTSLTQPKLIAVVKRKLDSIQHIRQSVDSNEVVTSDFKSHEFKNVTQKMIYSELIYRKSVDHVYQTKWLLEHDDLPSISWEDVWKSLHSQFFTEMTKSTIWEQIHLNFYTTSNYNKWHNNLLPCPLCHKIPEDAFHIILDCAFTSKMWNKIEPTILRILPISPTKYEKAFGLQPQNKRNKQEMEATILRNWITFSLRSHIMQEERRAYYFNGFSKNHENKFIQNFNLAMQTEIFHKHLQFRYMGLEQKFDAIINTNNIISKNNDGVYVWKHL